MFKKVILFALLIVALSNVANSATIAIDFGSDFIKVANVMPGKMMDTVVDYSSKRKTPNVVAFDNDMRVFGNEAKALATRKPNMYLGYAKYLLGNSIEGENYSHFKDHYYPYDLVQLNASGSIGFNVTGSHIDGVYSSEEIVAMVLQNIKNYSEAFALQPVIDAVITVPSYWTQFQRQALLDAASLTDLKIISLIDENTAAHLQYGISRVFENKTHRMMIYNMGSTSTQVSIAEYSSSQKKSFGKNVTSGVFEVIAKSWDITLGGNDLDLLMVELLVETFNEKYGVPKGLPDIRSDARAMAKLRQQAKKTKEILTANSYIPVWIEGLFMDVDFKSTVSREELETLAQSWSTRIISPIDQALASAGLSINEIDEIEVIGGGFRVPMVLKSLNEYFSRDPSVHLNGDESPALGAVFHAANQSTSFRVRHVGMQDITLFPIGVSLSELAAIDAVDPVDEDTKPWSKRATIITEKTHLGSKKVVAFHHDKDIMCKVYYPESDMLPVGTPTDIATYSIKGIEAIMEGDLAHLGAPKITLSYFLDISGILKLVKAEAMLEETVIVKEKKKVKKVKDSESETVAEEDEEETDSDEASEPASNDETTETTSTEVDESEKEVSDEDNEFIEISKVKKHRIPLTIERTDEGVLRRPMSADEMKISLDKLGKLDSNDEKRMLKEKAKNNLESYIYSVRAKVFDDHEDLLEIVTSEEQRDSLRAKMMDSEDWLYEDGDNAEVEEYELRLKELQADALEILTRMTEHSSRPKEVTKLRNQIGKLKNMVASWADDMPWINEDETERATTAIEATEEWLEAKETEQDELDLTEQPALLSSECKSRSKKLKLLVERIGKKSKPIPPKSKKKKKSKKSDGENEDDVSEDGGEKETKDEEEEQNVDLEETINEDDESVSEDAEDTHEEL